MFGHSGKLLFVNLTNSQIKIQGYDQDFARAFLGGNGFAASLIYDHLPPDTAPFDEANALVFAVGPLTDTPIWGTSRGHIASISPQTGFFGDSNFGGQFATSLKRAGYDAIYITGKSPTPVYLQVDESGGKLLDANNLWGMTTQQTNHHLQTKEGKDAISASIGPAGENQVIFANIICGGARPGTAGRCGMGAVMGSKNLKAVVAHGTQKTNIAHPDKLKNLLRQQRQTLKTNTSVLSQLGTPFLVDMINDRGLLATHNATRETFEFAHKINAQVLKQTYIEKNIACYGCPVACGKTVKVPTGQYAGKTVKMPEYETIYAFGSMLDNHDIVSIINANALCDHYGMDTISMGVTLSFLAQCLEAGQITKSQLGENVNFDDPSAMLQLIKATAFKQGIGELLALGSAKLAQKLGGDTYKYLYCAKSLEIPGHSARGQRPMNLGYATATRGGSHHDTRPKYLVPDSDPGFDSQAQYNIQSQHYTAVGDSLVMCRFLQEKGLGSTFNELISQTLNYVTGWDTDIDELNTIGERIYNLERLISIRRGLSRKDDTLPWRTMNEPIPNGPAQGRHCPHDTLQKMLDQYYHLRGWTPDGHPTKEKLAQLGLH